MAKTEYTIEEAAKKLKVVKETLWRWRRDGEGPAYIKRGGRYYYKAEAIKDWLEVGNDGE